MALLRDLECPSIQWNERTHVFSEEQVAIENVIAEPLDQRSGIQVYFLPSIRDLVKDLDVCSRLSNRFAIPEFFWTETASEANGFFRSRDNALHTFTAKSTQSRFLITELTMKNNGYNYEFLGFSTLWYVSNGKATQILLCFDLSERMRSMVSKNILASNPANISKCPFAIYDALLLPILRCYDSSLWNFRGPIRTIEKTRPFSDTPQIESEQHHRYEMMHELWRRIIIVHETVSVAIRTVSVLEERHGACCEKSGSCYGDIPLYASLLGNLQLRAGSYEKRCQNEISLAFNLATAADNNVMKKLASTSQLTAELTLRDSHIMRKIALLTLFFLPATFVSAIFSMSFFNYTPGTDGQDGSWTVSEHFWVYWAVAAPVTIISVFTWFFWRQVLPQNTINSLMAVDTAKEEKMVSH